MIFSRNRVEHCDRRFSTRNYCFHHRAKYSHIHASLWLLRAPEYLLTTTTSSNLMSGLVREYIIENKIYCYRYNHK